MIWLALLVALALLVTFPFLRERTRRPMDDLTRKQAPGKFAQLSQGVTHYQWIGPVRGPVAVCVHGLTTPSFVWLGIAKAMSQIGYRVLIYDLYGRGYSDRPDAPQDSAFFQQQLEELLAEQAVKGDITLLGYSMGGAIATIYAAAHPDRIRQLVLLAPAGIKSGNNAMARFIAETPMIGDWLMLALFPRNHRKGTELERTLPSSVDGIVDLQQAELAFQGFVPAVLASLRGLLSTRQDSEHRALYRAAIPVLAIWGRDDSVIPITAMGQLAEWNRNARQDVIDGAGHGLTYTHTDQILDTMRQTLRDGLN